MNTDKIIFCATFFLFCAAYLAAAFIKERNKTLKEVEKNRSSASLEELEQYKQKLLIFRKSLPVVIVELIRRKPFEKGNEAVENMLWRVDREIKDRLREQRQEEHGRQRKNKRRRRRNHNGNTMKKEART